MLPEEEDDHAISIHALREEGDASAPVLPATWGISIHALREEGDRRVVGQLGQRRNFYPRPPRGGRLRSAGLSDGHRLYFYPRPPRGGRPTMADDDSAYLDFYPRPPRGGRRISCSARSMRSNFYPRPPRGGRLALHDALHDVAIISIHALREEGDRAAERNNTWQQKFLSTPSARRATDGQGQR